MTETHNPFALAGARVDVHTHVLHGVDGDGSRDMTMSLLLLSAAAADGTAVIIATPHVKQGTNAGPLRIRQGVESLNYAAAQYGIPVRVVPGTEVFYSYMLPEMYAAGDLLTLNDNGYMLIEFGFAPPLPPTLTETLRALQDAGVRPILAHVERYTAVQDNPDVLQPFLAMGAVAQINADALTGRPGIPPTPALRATAETLLRRGMVHLIGSDTHEMRTRPPLLRAAFEVATAIVGTDAVAQITENAWRVLRGDTVPPRQ